MWSSTPHRTKCSVSRSRRPSSPATTWPSPRCSNGSPRRWGTPRCPAWSTGCRRSPLGPTGKVQRSRLAGLFATADPGPSRRAVGRRTPGGGGVALDRPSSDRSGRRLHRPRRGLPARHRGGRRAERPMGGRGAPGRSAGRRDRARPGPGAGRRCRGSARGCRSLSPIERRFPRCRSDVGRRGGRQHGLRLARRGGRRPRPAAPCADRRGVASSLAAHRLPRPLARGASSTMLTERSRGTTGASGTLGEAVGAAIRTARAPYDVGSGPLVRAGAWRYGPDAWIVGLGYHHLVCDGRSRRVLLDDWAQAYAGTFEPPGGTGRATPCSAPSPSRRRPWWRRRFDGVAPAARLARRDRPIEHRPPSSGRRPARRPRPQVASRAGHADHGARPPRRR